MSVNDPIGDMLTRIRNAASAGLETVEMPHSNLRENIAKILKAEGFITGSSVEKEGVHRTLRLQMKYDQDQEPVIRGLRRVSKPGLRRYVGASDLPRVVGGMGIAIISTSRGLLSDKDARKSKLGGEVLCYVW